MDETPSGLPRAPTNLIVTEKELIANYRLQTGEPAWSYDSLSREVDETLSQFVVRKNYMGYPFLVSAIREAVISLPEHLTITEVCEQVAAKEDTAVKAVSRELTRIVNRIWYHGANQPIYERIVGTKVIEKPMPLEFIYTMAIYLRRQTHPKKGSLGS